jgi:integrase
MSFKGFSGSMPNYNPTDFKRPVLKGRVTINKKTGKEYDNRIRIFRPKEFELLVKGCKKVEYQTMLEALLYTGTRYVELQRVQENPDWFDGEFLHLPYDAVKKDKRTQYERWVRLNQQGRTTLKFFLRLGTKLPSYQSWSMNMKRWARNVGMETKWLSSKCTRKTWESWLMFYYPNQLPAIALSQGHTQLTSLQHYTNLPFSEGDKNEMKKYVGGWI